MDISDRLRWAIRNNKLPMVQRLVRRFPDLLENIDSSNGWSSLHYASYDGHYAICVFLVQQGHDREEISLAHDRSTPLHLASSQNHEQTVHFLAQHIPRCLDWVNIEHETALMVAARKGHDPCINLLLDFGANIDIGNRESNRPIHVAAAYGHLKTLRTLVDRGADVQTPNFEGWRPVQYCSTYQVQDYLQSLIHEKSESSKRKLQSLPFSVHVDNNNIPSSNTKISPNPKVPSSLPRQYVAFQSKTSPKRNTVSTPKLSNYYSNGITTSDNMIPSSVLSTKPPDSPSPQRKPLHSLSGTLQLDKPLPIFSSSETFSPTGGGGSSSSNPNSPVGPPPGPMTFEAPPPRKASLPGTSSGFDSSKTSLATPSTPLGPSLATPQYSTPNLPMPNFSHSRNTTPSPQSSPYNDPTNNSTSQSTRLSGRSRLLDISVSTVHKH